MSFLVFWNNDHFAAKLSDCFGSTNVITSKEALADPANLPGLSSYLVVLCELDWQAEGTSGKYHSLYGIELIKKLRIEHDLNIHVLFVSFLSLPYILEAEREIVTAIGHSFYRLPVSPAALKCYVEQEFSALAPPGRLSEMEMNDIKSFYCNREGILSHELHSLSRFYHDAFSNGSYDQVYEDLIGVLSRIYRLFRVDDAAGIAQFRQQFTPLSQHTIRDAITYITNTGNQLQSQYEDCEPVAPPKSAAYPWRVLMLDDEIGEAHPLVRCMKDRGINIVCVSNAGEAFDVLKDDWQHKNDIMVVIADYRLYENSGGIKRHQRIQGYQFLHLLASSEHLMRLIAFSGLQRKFLLSSFKHFNVRTEIRSKNDYLLNDHTFNLFADEIIQLAEENQVAVEMIPHKCAGFAKYLEEGYRDFRRSAEYDRMEANISMTALKYVRQMEAQLLCGDTICIAPVDHIRTTMTRNKKNTSGYFMRLQNYFVARRIALWLHCVSKSEKRNSINARRIAEILTGQEYLTDAYRQILSSNLGLSLEDFPGNITIEERRWLQYEAGKNVFKDIRFIEHSFRKIEKLFSGFIGKCSLLAKEIADNQWVLYYKYKNTDYPIYFDKALAPSLKTLTDIRVLYLIIEKAAANAFSAGELLDLVSKARYEFLCASKENKYLSSIFNYFNELYHVLCIADDKTRQPANAVKGLRMTACNKADMNGHFETVFNLLHEDTPIARDAPADLMLLYAVGYSVKYEMGTLNESLRSVFYERMAAEYNYENGITYALPGESWFNDGEAVEYSGEE